MDDQRHGQDAGDRDRAWLLRREVGLLRRREQRRVFDAAVCVGVLGAGAARFVVRAQHLPVLDPGLRAEVVSTLLEDSPAGATEAWLVRPGVPHAGDADLAWLAAARMAFGMHGRRLAGFYAITRSGWLDVVTGERRQWKRLRL